MSGIIVMVLLLVVAVGITLYKCYKKFKSVVPRAAMDTLLIGLNFWQLTALLDRLGTDEESGKRFSEMEAGLRDPAANREDLMHKARELYRWRKGIIGRSVNERK